MINSNIPHRQINDTLEEPRFDDCNNFSLLVQVEEALPSADAVYYNPVFNEPATLVWTYEYGWINDCTGSAQSEFCLDPRLTIGNPGITMSGFDNGAYRPDAGNKQANDGLYETWGLSEGSIDGGLATTFVENNLEVIPYTTEGGPWEMTQEIWNAGSGGKWRSGVGSSEEMPYKERAPLEYATPIKRAAQLSQTKTHRAGVIWVGNDDGQEPDLERDLLGYALPTAVLDRLAQGGLKVEYWDRLFFPESEKHTKCPTRGHICHVQRKIVRRGQGQVAWEPVVTECRAQKSGESYRRHLLNCHLATPRGAKKRSNAKKPATRRPTEPTGSATDRCAEYDSQRSTEGSRVGKRRRDDEDDDTSHFQGEPSARNHSKRQRRA